MDSGWGGEGGSRGGAGGGGGGGWGGRGGPVRSRTCRLGGVPVPDKKWSQIKGRNQAPALRQFAPGNASIGSSSNSYVFGGSPIRGWPSKHQV